MSASSLCAADGMLGGSALCDPYVRARVGAGAAGSNAALPDGVGMERGDALPQTLEPQFYRSFELATTVPGPSRLHVRVLDKNLGLTQAADDLVGELVVDVEDRWFDPAWQALAKKPVERRALSLPDRSSASTQAARGNLSFCESPRAVRGGYFGVRAQTCVCEPACRVRRWVFVRERRRACALTCVALSQYGSVAQGSTCCRAARRATCRSRRSRHRWSCRSRCA
jgi:hypothetical protein